MISGMASRTEYHRNYARVNKETRNARQRKWRADNPERSREAQRRYRVAQYGLTLEDFDRMLAEQGGNCAICLKPLPEDSLHVHIDHCHKTGAVRGLLCKNCNIGLGNFADDPEVLQRAIKYLCG